MRIRSADMITILRTILILAIVYLVLYRFNPILITVLIGIALASDALDGYFALREESMGKISFMEYVNASVLGNAEAKARMKDIKRRIAASAPFGSRIDVAGDRVAEYAFWFLGVYTHIIPLIIALLVIVRHSFADAFMAAKGTSAKMKSKLAQVFYASNWSRALANILKFLAFSYLGFVYVWAYPIAYEYALVGLLFALIMLRGIAEIYESTL